MQAKLGENLGRLFEMGFNLGILAELEQHHFGENWVNLYRPDLAKLKFPNLLKEIANRTNIIDRSLEMQQVDKWSQFLLLKGFLGGLNFFRDYLKSTGWNQQRIEILYYQCSFSNQNSIGTHNKPDEFIHILSEFKYLPKDDIQRYIRQYSGAGKAGEFLQADTLMLLRYRDSFRILCVDLSAFSPKLAESPVDLEEIQEMRRLLQREIGYLRSKSVFAKLRIDTGNKNELGFAVSENLQRHLTAFSYHDKETCKLIQAGSYSHSFYRFLREIDLFTDETSVVFNVVGYSNRGISAISLSKENLDFLATCAKIYQNKPKEQDINRARKQVLDTIELNASRSFTDGKKFIKELLEIPTDTTTIIRHTERIEGFNSTSELREEHAELITQALASDKTYIFLTGNPGIGKTTAIVNFLQAHTNEGFLFLYVSPRKQVNLDIIEKFRDERTGKLFDDRLFCLNTNQQLIEDNFFGCVVNYYSNKYQGKISQKAVTFLDATQKSEHSSSHQQQLWQETETKIIAKNRPKKGVLSCLSEAIHTVLKTEISNNIVATACIQSLRMTPNRKNTLEHLKQIFKSAYNERNRQIDVPEMQRISSRIKHLFIMIDEITGDDGGVEFLNGITSFLSTYDLTNPQNGFNTKVIVADASIVDRNVIQQHLSETSPEPDKIFFRRATSPRSLSPSKEEFEFRKSQAVAINANSYPASSLLVSYKVFVESIKFDEETFANQKDNLKKTVQREIVEDINKLYNRADAGQILVYIQDKKRLYQLIEKIKQQKGQFENNIDYLEIHAYTPDEKRTEIEKYKNDVKIIFMTSSASRGLSFPKARHILVEIPRFRVESNLMEIVQVIYRGRGDYTECGVKKTFDNQERELNFYLNDRAVYYDDDKELSWQESIINILNILLIVKICVMTRIQGYGKLGRENFMMIPIGGKSVSAAGQTFSGKMASLIKDLKNEHRTHPDRQQLLRVYTSLEQLLSRTEFTLFKNSSSDTIDYLQLRKKFMQQFSQIITDGFDNLLKYGNIQPGHISGSLLVVNIGEQRLEETYEMRLQEIAKHATDELLDQMWKISCSLNYPGSLRSNIKNAIELIEKLKQPQGKTQSLEQNSQRLDQYYALPLFGFISGEVMSEYFASEPEAAEDKRFRDILATYIHHLYPTDKTLPIGYKYQDFPFIVFSSYSLEEIKQKMFTDKYLLTSNELNVLNLILSKKDE